MSDGTLSKCIRVLARERERERDRGVAEGGRGGGEKQIEIKGNVPLQRDPHNRPGLLAIIY